jgi:hypothetical protein
MSVWGTWLTIEHPDDWIAALEAEGIRAGVIGDDSGERELGSPIIYQGSHVVPSDDDARGGSVGVAAINGWVTRDGRDDGPDEDGVWPYLRLSVDERDAEGGTVILDRAQVTELAATLNEWIERTVVGSKTA